MRLFLFSSKNNIPESSPKSVDPTCLLLLSGSPVVGSTVFIDRSITTKTITKTGNVQNSNLKTKYNPTSIDLDSSGGKLSVSPVTEFNFGTNDFTVQFHMFVKPENHGGYYELWMINHSGLVDGYGLGMRFADSGFQSKLQFSTVYNTLASCYGIADTRATLANTWNHFALVRKNGIINIYKNGIKQQVRNGTYSGPLIYDVPDSVSINAVSNVRLGNFAGAYIDDFKINNYAVYTDNFTPPDSSN